MSNNNQTRARTRPRPGANLSLVSQSKFKLEDCKRSNSSKRFQFLNSPSGQLHVSILILATIYQFISTLNASQSQLPVIHSTATATASASNSKQNSNVNPNFGPFGAGENFRREENLPIFGHDALAQNQAQDDELLTLASSVVSHRRAARQLTGDDTVPGASDSSTSSSPAETTGWPVADRDDEQLSSRQQQQPYDYHANMPVITKRELGNAIKQATSAIERRLQGGVPTSETGKSARGSSDFLDFSSATEYELATGGGGDENNILLEAGTNGWLASSMFHKPAPEDAFVQNQTRQALISEEATRLLAKQFKLNREQTTRGLPLISVDQTSLGRACPRSARLHNCIPGRYRSLTGHCNNVQQADWGSAQTALVRYAPARYLDHIALPVMRENFRLISNSTTAAIINQQLPPSARAVSVALHEAAASQAATAQLHSHMTTMLSFFGQFLFHDLAFVPQFSKSIKCCHSTGAPHSIQHSECMPIEHNDNNNNNNNNKHKSYFCLDYVRSTPAVRNGCNLGARDQLNLVSSFLDGSVIYGSSETQMRHLRSFSGGRLRSQRPLSMQTGSGRSIQQQAVPLELLPQIKLRNTSKQQQQQEQLNSSASSDLHWLAAARDCYQMAVMRARKTGNNFAAAGGRSFSSSDLPAASMMQQMHLNCFQAGDLRVNENLGLTLMHTIWMREHNLVADKLGALNRHWRDERLFEEARRIVVAELQQIAYNEFLPSILGEEVMQRFNLSLASQGYFQGYDPSINPGVANELATAVFPFILSTIPSALERYSDRLEMLGTTNLADTFMDASDLFKRNKFAQYLTGMMSQSAMEPALGLVPMTMAMDSSSLASSQLPRGEHSSEPLTRSPVENVSVGGGFSRDQHEESPLRNVSESSSSSSSSMRAPQVDVVALTIQQGRDHGLRSYLYWRRACQLKPTIRTWSDLEQVMMSKQTVDKLRQVYASPEQLDLYLALLETPAAGATLGPTFVCLLARQFFQLKHGDRYWFENDLPGVAFTPGQLDELRQTSLAKVICRNSQASISFIQPAPMLASDPYLNAYQYCTNKAMTGTGNEHDLDLTKWREQVNSASQLVDEFDEHTGSGGLTNEDNGDHFSAAAGAQVRARRQQQHEHFGNVRALQRGKRLIEENKENISLELARSRSKLDEFARQETSRLRAGMAAKVRARRASGVGFHNNGHAHHPAAAGYRYLPRLKRQALSIQNQSVILGLATNEAVRALVRAGKDREHAQSLQADIRDFLYSLESFQLDNLLDNSASNERVQEFIAQANSFFLTAEQRARLAAAGDPTLTSDPLADALATNARETTTSAQQQQQQQQQQARSNSISMNCQDDEQTFPCDHTSPFRTITGWCNNLLHPKFGASFTQHDRILPSAYEDGLATPRSFSVLALEAPSSALEAERLPLPSARLISTTMHDDASQLHVRYSLALMQFGQFGVDHDLTRTPFSVALDGSLLDCSDCNSRLTLHRDCLPIEIPDNDPFYQSIEARRAQASPSPARQRQLSLQSTSTNTNANANALPPIVKKCLHFVRSLNGQLALGPRQQLNALTSYLDASEIYGSDNCEAKSLRSFQGGRLNSSAYPITSKDSLSYTPREILPITRQNPECVTPGGLCFHAGDQRASEQPGLTAIHTIFLRLHNSIVDQLAQVNRHWNDEKLYQNGRRIVAAILQRITFGEFVPRLLGLDYMSKFDLLLKQVGYAPLGHYDETCSANIFTEFSAAAFRMGHSLIRASFPLLNKAYQQTGKPFQLRTAFFNSHRILSEPQLIDSILRGIVSTPIETLDNSITDELTNHLFEKAREPYSGMDLIALNIQRARDHGIGGYNRYRAKCNLTRARTFDDLSGEIPARLIRRLTSLYASVDDIDLFTGGLSETPVHGGIIGPTFGCIIGMQFARLKRCDRFWHETSDPYVRFSAPQLAEIRKITLAKVFCSQSDTINTIQRQAMDVPDNYLNPRVPCSSLPSLDLTVWRENQKSCQTAQKIKIDLGHSRRVSPCRSCTCTLEGPVCRTVKINCLKMMQKATSSRQANGQSQLNQIMADKACLVQCAWALDMQPQ